MFGFPFPVWGQQQQPPATVDEALRTSRLIAVALLVGEFVFIGVVAFVDLDLGNSLNPLLHSAATLALVAVAMALLVRNTLLKRAGELEGPPRFAKVMAATISSYALLEGAALFNIVAWMVTGEIVPAGPVIGLLIALQLMLFPRRSHFEPAE